MCTYIYIYIIMSLTCRVLFVGYIVAEPAQLLGIMLCYVMVFNVIVHYTILCHITLHYILHIIYIAIIVCRHVNYMF